MRKTRPSRCFTQMVRLRPCIFRFYLMPTQFYAEAQRVEDLPNIEQRANCTPPSQELYAFAYRGESGAVHSTAVVLGAHSAGQPPLPEALMVDNVLAASMPVLGSAANLLEEPRLGDIARRIQAELTNKPPSPSEK